jgi:carboxynorspermidine decarboxylase
MMKTLHYLIDKSQLLRNLKRIEHLREKSGAKALLALKCFAAWSVFDFMRPFMDGTTSSSLNEVRLGSTRFAARPTPTASPGQITRSTKRPRSPTR